MIQIQVTGMNCQHCVSAVTKAAQRVPGVEQVEVSLESGHATVIGEADPEGVVAAIEAEGYSAQVV